MGDIKSANMAVSNMTELQKTRKIKAEVRRITSIFEDFGVEDASLYEMLIGSAAFIAVVLEDLEISIKKNGVVSRYQNGANQWGTKKSPEVETYATFSKLYKDIIKDLDSKLPRDASVIDDGFDDFRLERDDN